MNFVIFDTETTSLEKPFCYNIGYIIGNENGETLLKREFIVEQIWHNLPLFSTAYYAEKRPLYIPLMRAKKITMDKFGYICSQMRRDFLKYEVQFAFAYNSPFDEKVFNFNCDWFKVINPFETIIISDIRGFAHHFIVNDDYKKFCEDNNLFTETGNYSTTAETMFRYITNNIDFIEQHTALNDSEIEYEILLKCLKNGADITKDYKAFRSIPRTIEKILTLTTTDKKQYHFRYNKIKINKGKTNIVLE